MTRLSARVTVFLLALTFGFAAMAAPALASCPPRPAPGQAAAGWLARQMAHGSHFTETYDGVTYPDQGLTIDAIYAFAATGTARGYAARAIAWLARPYILSNYIGNGTTESYAGATANVLLASEVDGQNPAAFGGVNLPARLASLLTPSGRYSDHSKYGDYSNAFSQSLAIIATSRLGGAAASAVNFLASSQCANGGFPLYFAQAKCVSYPDATAMDVQALLAAGKFGPAERGLRWLASAQQPDGGFIAPPGKIPNSNSTGLAGEAFAAGGWFPQAASARSFLLSVQVGCSGKPVNQGAIAYNTNGYRKTTAAFATAQGILGLADAGLARLSIRGARPGAPHLACPS
jgi:Prenyltransferase and squalene oxidase repeat